MHSPSVEGPLSVAEGALRSSQHSGGFGGQGGIQGANSSSCLTDGQELRQSGQRGLNPTFFLPSCPPSPLPPVPYPFLFSLSSHPPTPHPSWPVSSLPPAALGC